MTAPALLRLVQKSVPSESTARPAGYSSSAIKSGAPGGVLERSTFQIPPPGRSGSFDLASKLAQTTEVLPLLPTLIAMARGVRCFVATATVWLELAREQATTPSDVISLSSYVQQTALAAAAMPRGEVPGGLG